MEGLAASDARLLVVVGAAARLAMPLAVPATFFFSSPEVSEVLPASASELEALVEEVKRRAEDVAGATRVGGLLMLLPKFERGVVNVAGFEVLEPKADFMVVVGRFGGRVEGVGFFGAAVLLVASGDRGMDLLTSGWTFSVTTGAGAGASSVAVGTGVSVVSAIV